MLSKLIVLREAEMLFFTRWFWGVMLVFLGALLLVQNYFGIHVAIGRYFWPIFVLFAGISILSSGLGRSVPRHRTQVAFEQGELRPYSREKNYQSVFGEGIFDFRELKVPVAGKDYLNVGVYFGGGILKIRQNIPVKIEASGVFGSVRFPDGSMSAFVEKIYTTRAFREGRPHVVIRTHAVFGGLDIIEE